MAFPSCMDLFDDPEALGKPMPWSLHQLLHDGVTTVSTSSPLSSSLVCGPSLSLFLPTSQCQETLWSRFCPHPSHWPPTKERMSWWLWWLGDFDRSLLPELLCSLGFLVNEYPSLLLHVWQILSRSFVSCSFLCPLFKSVVKKLNLFFFFAVESFLTDETLCTSKPTLKKKSRTLQLLCLNIGAGGAGVAPFPSHLLSQKLRGHLFRSWGSEKLSLQTTVLAVEIPLTWPLAVSLHNANWMATVIILEVNSSYPSSKGSVCRGGEPHPILLSYSFFQASFRWLRNETQGTE